MTVGQQQADVLREFHVAADTVAHDVILTVPVPLGQILQNDVAADTVGVFKAATEAVLPVLGSMYPAMVLCFLRKLICNLAAN